MLLFQPAALAGKTSGRRPAMVILPVALAYVILSWPLINILEITETGTGRIKWRARIGPETLITLSFVHSVNKRPVYDTLLAQGNCLKIIKSRFDAFGAGMPETSTDAGTLTVLPDGWLEWTINNPPPQSEIIVRVGRVANHVLTLAGHEITLADLAAPGSALTLRARKVSLYSFLKGGWP